MQGVGGFFVTLPKNLLDIIFLSVYNDDTFVAVANLLAHEVVITLNVER